MKLKFKNPIIPFNLTKTGAVDQLQAYLQNLYPSAWVGFSMDFGENTIEVESDADISNLILGEEVGETVEELKSIIAEKESVISTLKSENEILQAKEWTDVEVEK